MAFALVGAIGLGACSSDDPVGIDEELDQGVERIQLMSDSQIIAEYDGTSWTGDLNVTEGTSTARIDVRLVDHNGDDVTPPSDVDLAVDVTNEVVALWEQTSAGEFGGQLQGVAAGQTDAVFKLMRGGQEEFVTTGVDVQVTAP